MDVGFALRLGLFVVFSYVSAGYLSCSLLFVLKEKGVETL